MSMSRVVPWAFETIRDHIDDRMPLIQGTPFTNRMKILHERITGMSRNPDHLMPDMFESFLTGTNTFDAIACWFLLLLLHDQDWGIRRRTTDAADLAAIDRASELLKRWLQGDATESGDWKKLLPNPEDAEERGTMSSAGYVAAALGRPFLNLSLGPVLDAAAHAYIGVQFPKRSLKPFPMGLSDKIIGYTLLVFLYPVIKWVRRKRSPKIAINSQYFMVLAHALERLCELRWDPKDPEEADLFPKVICSSQPETLQKYIACLRRQHVEPGEIADAQDILTRMAAVAKTIGLQFADPRFMTGMATRRLYTVEGNPPPVLAAMRTINNHVDGQWYKFAMSVTGNRLQIVDEVTNSTPAKAWKEFETKYDDIVGKVEEPTPLSERVFYRMQPEPEYWTIQLEWGGAYRYLPAKNEGEEQESLKVFRVVLHWGPWPVEGSLWEPPETQHERRVEFPTRSAALAWYRQEVDRKMAEGYTESLPRLHYFSMKAPPVAVTEPRILYDTHVRLGGPEEKWIEQLPLPAFRPRVEAGDGPADASKLAGSVLSPVGASWPTCGSCKKPMALLLQLNLDQLPAELQHRFGSGLLQFFACRYEGDCKGDRAAFSDTQLGRIVDPKQPHETIKAPVTAAPAPQSIVSWLPKTDYPAEQNYGEFNFYDLGSEAQDWQVTKALARKFPCMSGDKLGGYPSDYTDYCPDCSKPLQLVFQMNSSGLIPFSMWEDAIGMILQCPEHHDKLALTTRTK